MIHGHIPHHVETGSLSPIQRWTLRQYISGRRVHDLGAGKSLYLAQSLLDLGAEHVTAVDKVFAPGERANSERLQTVGCWFHEYRPVTPPEVSFVSWPPNLILVPPAPWIIQGLIDLCAASPVVVYLGSNFGSVCGNPGFWRHLGTREVLAHVPDARNTLIVYGRQGGRVPGQGLLPEEKAALYRPVTPTPTYGVTYGA